MASLIQANIVAALMKFGFEGEESGPPGSPEKLKITEETAKKIESLVGKTVEVDADGEITGL